MAVDSDTQRACAVCHDPLPDYPEEPGACSCGACTWLYLDGAGWFGDGPTEERAREQDTE